MMMLYQMVVTIVAVSLVDGHGRMIDPLQRSSLWRSNTSYPRNYDDNQLFCGGILIQHHYNKGLCGACGDDYSLGTPRPNENGGLYGSGHVVRAFKAGTYEAIKVKIDANHRGYFEFFLQRTPYKEDSKSDYHRLIVNNNGTRHYLDGHEHYAGVSVLIPYLKCSRCTFVWQWRVANNWGRCEDGTSRVGCGPQETYINCADVSVV